MITPSPVHRGRTRSRRALLAGLLALVAILLLAGCGGDGGGDGAKLLSYQRVWPDGRTESQTIWRDGRVEMLHGESRERMTISDSAVTLILDALAQPIPTDAPGASPARTLTLADGSVIDAPRPDPGTVTQLLERLLDTHTVG